MNTTFSRIIERYGDDAVLHGNGETTEIKCFLQPVMRRTHDRRWRDMTELGEKDTSRYYAFFPADAPLDGCGYVSVGERDFDIVRKEAYIVEKRVSHWESILTVREEEYDG